MPRPIFVLNGPNLNMLGTREPHIYGATTLREVEAMCHERAAKLGHTVSFRQSNHEGEIISWIHEAHTGAEGVVINPAGYTHTSVAILDALKILKQPIIELHITNPHQRESFRHLSYVSYAATGAVYGIGVDGYPIALEAVAALIARRAKG